MLETSESSGERTYRLNFKQSAKGIWQAEYTVRANTEQELNAALLIARDVVRHQLSELNNLGGEKEHEKENITSSAYAHDEEDC